MKLTIGPRTKAFLIISAKSAVNAIITNTGLMMAFSSVFNAHSTLGVVNLCKSTLIVVVSREALVWGPRILAWSQSTSADTIDISRPEGPIEGPVDHGTKSMFTSAGK